MALIRYSYSNQAFEVLEVIGNRKPEALACALKSIEKELDDCGDGVVTAEVRFTLDDGRYCISFAALVNRPQVHITEVGWELS